MKLQSTGFMLLPKMFLWICMCQESSGTDGAECVCSRATWHCGLLTLDGAAVWSEGGLPREQNAATGLARVPGTLSSGFSLKCNLALISSNNLETWARCLCVCVSKGKILSVTERVSVSTFFVCVANTRQPHRSHCCDPVPGAGRQSRAPLTGGSTISHSSADGPVYSTRQRHRANEQTTRKKSHTKIYRYHVVRLQRHKLASWQTVMLCRRTLCDSRRMMPESTQRDQVN